MAFLLEHTRRVVVKLGTGILTSGIGDLHEERIHAICREVAALHRRGVEVVIVSSGAIALGMGQLGLKRRPTDVASLQTCAAIGQARLIQTWQAGFEPEDLAVAQVLFTRDDLKSRRRHVAALHMLESVISKGVIPVVNENDSISTEEIQFGDNDVLSALVASLVKADQLIILSKAPGLVNLRGDGKLVPVVTEYTEAILAMAEGTADPTGRGGMVTKLEAAQIANKSGCGVFIGSGEDPGILNQLFAGDPEGTFFMPSRLPMASKKRWIAFFQKPLGQLRVDDGARTALLQNGKSLLAKGITGLEGHFSPESVVEILDAAGAPIARGITHYGSEQLHRVQGRSNDAIQAEFPDQKRLEVVHRDELVLL